jgi:adenylate kinase family enzyme
MSNAKLTSNSRVMVVGTSGSGKSTFSRRLSAKLGLKDIELDALFWGPDWTQTPQPEFRLKIERAMEDHSGWVIHGNYSKVRDITWKKATTLVWLDYSRRVVFWRVFKRSVTRILTREPLWSGNTETFRKTFLSKDSILLWSFQTYKLRKEQYEELTKASEFSHLNIIRFKDPGEAAKFLAEL